MKAQELRIDNYIYDNQIGFRGEFKVSIGDIVDIYKDPFDNEYSYIELTKQWLLDFGFELDLEFLSDFIWRKETTTGEIVLSGKDFLLCSTDTRCNIKHVHQLQNLYFVLTGEELTKKS